MTTDADPHPALHHSAGLQIQAGQSHSLTSLVTVVSLRCDAGPMWLRVLHGDCSAGWGRGLRASGLSWGCQWLRLPLHGEDLSLMGHREASIPREPEGRSRSGNPRVGSPRPHLLPLFLILSVVQLHGRSGSVSAQAALSLVSLTVFTDAPLTYRELKRLFPSTQQRWGAGSHRQRSRDLWFHSSYLIKPCIFFLLI